MGNIPQIAQPARIPIILSTPGYLMDHHFQGQPVLPAVEAMQALARSVKEIHPHWRVDCITDARFEKFLFMDPCSDQIEAWVEWQELGNGMLQAALLTRAKARNTAFTRTKIHARMNFDRTAPAPTRWPLDMTAALEGICTTVAPESIYKDLVPLGPAFRNIKSPLFISPDGALARIETPPRKHHEPIGSGHLGSSYALDAAFHAACVWSQHYRGIVGFPVAVDRRTIIKPTCPDQTCFGRILPKTMSADLLCFDILLSDENGHVCEIAEGVYMRDVSGGRLQPPVWIRRENSPDPLDNLRKACMAMAIVELDGLTCFAPQILTALENQRFQKMGARRRQSYLGARLALKRLYRKCREEDWATPASHIETFCKDSPLPCIGPDSSNRKYYCSVSHDRRFAIAVADRRVLGVDVEAISPKALKSARIFMSPREQEMMRQAPIDARAAAVRIWSIKEAAAKATGMNLADSWNRVQVTSVGPEQSRLSIDATRMTAQHATVDDHLFTLITAGNNP